MGEQLSVIKLIAEASLVVQLVMALMCQGGFFHPVLQVDGRQALYLEGLAGAHLHRLTVEGSQSFFRFGTGEGHVALFQGDAPPGRLDIDALDERLVGCLEVDEELHTVCQGFFLQPVENVRREKVPDAPVVRTDRVLLSADVEPMDNEPLGGQ